MTETKKKTHELMSLTLILFAFSAVTALLLGLVNGVTKDRIQVIGEENTKIAMQQVLMADSYEELGYTGGDPSVLAVYKAGDAGYVVQLSVSGSQAMISMVVGVDNGGAVTGIGITKHTETPGLGAVAADKTDAGVNFRQQFAGTTGSLSVNKDGGTIDALTGATVTSRAVTNGVNSAVEAVKTLG
jgi:electron transport complex protein RnfG